MKTSLSIDDAVYRDAREEARRTGKTLSETISEWARIGRLAQQGRKKGARKLRSVDLGDTLLDVNSRDGWYEALDESGARY